MPRRVVRKERGVFEKVPGSDIWWIRFKVIGVAHREKVGRYVHEAVIACASAIMARSRPELCSATVKQA
jgi:hypothetical protein